MAKSTNRLSVTLDDDIQEAFRRMRPQWGEQRQIINDALRRHLALQPSEDEPQDAEERDLVRDVLAARNAVYFLANIGGIHHALA